MAQGPASCTLKPASKKPGSRTWHKPVMAATLHLIPEPRSFWSDRARAAFEQNVFAPEYEMDDAMAIDHEAVITEYKEMKGFLQTSNTRQFAPKLYSELPETPVKELELDGGTSPPGLQACTPHTDVQSPLRRTSPVWWSLEVGLWTVQSTQVGQAAETGGADSPRNPYSPIWNFTPCLYTEEDVKKQVEAGLRPAPESIRGGFWASYDEDRYRPRPGPCLLCSMSMAIAGL